MSSVQFLDRPGEPRLAWCIDAPPTAPVGRVILIHGYADHSARFEHVVKAWNERGLTVARLDLRGHGHSGGARGHVMHVDEYVGDVRAVLGALASNPEWTRVRPRPIVFGHSMGGLVATELALVAGTELAGVACTSPFFGPKRRVSALELGAGKLALRAFPKLRQSSGLSGSDMTHDEKVVQSYDRDPYHFNHVTIGWFFAMLESQKRVLERASALQGPLFCIAAGDDRVVSNRATEQFFERAGCREKELDVSPSSFHELLNEPDWRHHAGRLAERMLRWSAA
ncbi:MAG TPA: alpha/beta hydrolase [Polyangiaceae bacterium]|jgi:lysophospholipase|nr:alpha/beta hydrolase [Polyangiaceae bacterium]